MASASKCGVKTHQPLPDLREPPRHRHLPLQLHPHVHLRVHTHLAPPRHPPDATHRQHDLPKGARSGGSAWDGHRQQVEILSALEGVAQVVEVARHQNEDLLVGEEEQFAPGRHRGGQAGVAVDEGVQFALQGDVHQRSHVGLGGDGEAEGVEEDGPLLPAHPAVHLKREGDGGFRDIFAIRFVDIENAGQSVGVRVDEFGVGVLGVNNGLLIELHNQCGQSIILVTDLPMSRENSIRKCLLDEQSAPKKQVPTDINGWMETQAKHRPQLLVRRRQPSQPLFPTQREQPKDNPVMEELQKAINRSRERLPLYEKKLECGLHSSRERVQGEKKADGASTHCSNNMVSLLLGSEESVGRAEVDVKVKPFNSGYVLHQLRRRGKQQRYLKQFSPQHQTDPIQKTGVQSISCLRKRIDCGIKSGRLRTLPP